MSATFGSGAGGSSPGGGMSMGGKPTVQKQSRKNDGVRTALTVLHPGVNFNFDVDAWRDWYVHNQSTSNIDLRREQ